MSRQVTIVLASLFIFTGCTGKVPELGVENGKLKQCPNTPNCINSQAKDEKQYIEPIFFDDPPGKAKESILRALDELEGSQVVAVEDNYIRAEFSSKIFRFIDDVELYFPDRGEKQLVVHIRSASRVGYSDLGVNRKRIEKIRRKIETLKSTSG